MSGSRSPLQIAAIAKGGSDYPKQMGQTGLFQTISHGTTRQADGTRKS